MYIQLAQFITPLTAFSIKFESRGHSLTVPILFAIDRNYTH